MGRYCSFQKYVCMFKNRLKLIRSNRFCLDSSRRKWGKNTGTISTTVLCAVLKKIVMIIKQCWQLALFFFADYRYPATTGRGNQPIPGDITHFTPSINLPMKTLYMNPFPSAIDALLPNYQEPILITLKSSQKYFIHNQSYLPSDHAVAPAHWGVTMATSFVLINGICQ